MSKDNTSDHSSFHSSKAFCGNAGPEEMKHFYRLLEALKDDQVAMLVDAVGIKFGSPNEEIDRVTLESVLDEADREDFYREYYKILTKR